MLAKFILIVFGSTVIGACASTGIYEGGDDLVAGPDWYTEFEDEEDDRIYGYGTSAGERNYTLAEASAAASARQNMAAFLKATVKAVLDRFIKETTGGEAMRSKLGSQQTMQELTDATLRGFRISKKQSKGKLLYVRGYLDMNKFKEAIHSSRQVKAALDEISEEAEAASKRMNRILDEEAERERSRR